MKDITAHIRELLFRHDCVILPSFGGFIGNYRPAQIDRATSTFKPPVKALSFNRNLTHNDGLLIGKISEERNIGYADSLRIVEDYIGSVKQRLEKGERVAFERIGYFQLNDEGNIEFEPDRDENFLLDSYGFTSFRREPVLSYSPSGRLNRDIDPVRSSGRKMAWRAAIAVPLLAAMILVPLKTDLFSSKASLNPISGLEIADSELVEHNDIELVQDEKESNTQILHSVQDDKAIQEGKAEVSKVFYHVVAGSFRSHENAKRMAEEAGAKGYEAEISENKNGYYRVLLNSLTSKQEALTLREKVRADYSDCWILTE